MTSFFQSKTRSAGDEIIVVDLGVCFTKAVHLRNGTSRPTLVSYVVLNTPTKGYLTDLEVMTQHLQHVIGELRTSVPDVIITCSFPGAVVSHVDLRAASVTDLRTLIRLKAKKLLQRTLDDHAVDCVVVDPPPMKENDPQSGVDPSPGQGETGKAEGQTLLAAVENSVVELIHGACKAAKLNLRSLSVNSVDGANALISHEHSSISGGSAILDMGFRQTRINVVFNKTIVLSRTFQLGSYDMTKGLAESMGITYEAADGLKTTMPEKIQEKLKPLLMPLVQDLLVTVDYFEDRTEQMVYNAVMSGGFACSQTLVDLFDAELLLPNCRSWKPVSDFAEIEDPGSVPHLEKDEHKLTNAIGAGLAWFDPKIKTVNLLAEIQEEEALQRRDPVRRAKIISYIILTVMLLWLGLNVLILNSHARHEQRLIGELGQVQVKMKALRDFSRSAVLSAKKGKELKIYSSRRFYAASILNSLQFATIEGVQFTLLNFENSYTTQTVSYLDGGGARKRKTYW